MTDAVEAQEIITDIQRKFSEFGSIRGIRKDILPWKLWEKAKKLMWDPADLDFSKDVEQWNAFSFEQKLGVIQLARGFMVGEEGVTLDILPLVLAMSDEGRTEETMFLTTFVFEEAKHVDFFRRWFDAVGVDFAEVDQIVFARLRDRGIEPPSDESRNPMFQIILPKVMRRLLVDRSSQALLDAAVTYNQFVEGCLAIAGYRLWSGMFAQFGVMPGLQEGLSLVQRDERRHIAYGTYLCRRLISAEPELFEYAAQRMYDLRDGYVSGMQPGQSGGYGSDGGGPQDQQQQALNATFAFFSPFREQVLKQVDRRVEVMSKARALKPDEAESGVGVEEIEAEAEKE